MSKNGDFVLIWYRIRKDWWCSLTGTDNAVKVLCDEMLKALCVFSVDGPDCLT